MWRVDYVGKLEAMIQEGIANGKYIETEDNTIKDLRTFQNFLTRNFKSTLPLEKIKPTTNQPSFLYGTAKTHKFNNPGKITKENLKLRPIVSTCGTFYSETAKYLASYLLPLTENEYSVKTTTDLANHLNNRTLSDDEVLVSYDVSHFSLKYLLMTPLTTSSKKSTRTTNYLNSVLNFSLQAPSL